MTETRSLSYKDIASLHRATGVLKVFHNYDGDFPLLYALCLIEIACTPHMTITDLSHKTNAPLSTLSRAIGALSNARQKGEAYGLIHAELKGRTKHLSLTVKGYALIKHVIKTTANQSD